MIQAIIVDDEANNVTSLRNLLTKFCPEITVVGTAEDANAGYELIRWDPLESTCRHASLSIL